VRDALVGRRVCSVACRDARISKRVSHTASAEAEPRSRALYKDKGRECPSLMVSGSRVENARALDRSKGRKHPSLPETEIEPRTSELLTGAEAENTEPSGDGFEGRECPCLREIKSREHSCSLRIRRVEIRIAVAENTHTISWIGSDLVLIAPRWAVLYSRPGYGVVAARLRRTRGAGRAVCV